MAFDAVSGTTLLFGGRDAAGAALGDTWTWNGAAWSPVAPAASPLPRSYGVLVPTGGRPLLYGGQNAAAGLLTDLWQWTGTTWVNLGPFSPSPRTNYGAAYDKRRDRTVVFGGMSSNNRQTASYNAETWEWNGSAWTQRLPLNSPSARGWCKLAYDEARSRIVLYGGANATTTLQDTWEWDGTNWTQRAPTANPPGAYGHDVTFDRARQLTIAFGSFGTWDYGAVNPGKTYPPVQTRLGCPTSVSAGQNFRLRTLPWTGPWAGDAIEMEFDYAPPGLGMFLWGFSDFGLGPSIPLFVFNSPNCFAHVPGDILEVLPLSATRYTSSFVIPNVSAALGFKLYGQGAWFDLGQPVFPTIVTTDELVFEVGQK